MDTTKISDELVGGGCGCTCSTLADEMIRQGEQQQSECGGKSCEKPPPRAPFGKHENT